MAAFRIAELEPSPGLLRQAAKEAGLRTAAAVAAALHGLGGSRAGDRLAILTYHRVADAPGLPKPWHNVPPAALRRQLDGLLARGYRFLPLQEALRLRDTGFPRRSLVLTFDDGYATMYHEVLPILRRLGIPATLFVSTAYLDATEPFPFDAWGLRFRHRAAPSTWLPLSTQECRALVESGLVELGSHTHTHADLRGRPDALAAEIARSIAVLDERFGPEPRSFAYPFGSRRLGFAGGRLEEAVRRSGVRCALSTQPELVAPQSDPLAWGRFNVFDWDSPTTLAARLAGWYGWMPALRRWAQPTAVEVAQP